MNITADDLRAIFEFVATRIEKEQHALNALDAAIGDGDHGITMRIGFEAIARAISGLPVESSISDVLDTAGKTFTNETGGAIGVILGTMFTSAAKAMRGCSQMSTEEFRTFLTAMEEGAVKAGKAKPGDKTLVDAVHAACESVDEMAPNSSLVAAVSGAADGAEAGARNTAEMLCRRGRASRLGERVLGHPDPGAVSFSLVLRSMAEWLEAKKTIAQGGVSIVASKANACF